MFCGCTWLHPTAQPNGKVLSQTGCPPNPRVSPPHLQVLPPNLVRLVVSDCPRAAPLLALGGLQALAMQASTMDAAQLAQVRRVGTRTMNGVAV